MTSEHDPSPARASASKEPKQSATRLAAWALAAIAAVALFALGAPGPREAAAQEEPGAATDSGQRRQAQASIVGRWTGYTHWSTRYDTYWDIKDDGTVSFGTTPAADNFHGTWETSGTSFTAYIEGSTYRGTIAGDVISGAASRTDNSGTFRITRASVAGTVWDVDASWSSNPFTWTFARGGSYRDSDGPTGTWTEDGASVVLTSQGGFVYRAVRRGDELTGEVYEAASGRQRGTFRARLQR